MMTREEFEAILQEAYDAGREDAYSAVEAAIQESEEIEIEDEEPMDESEEIEITDEELEGLDEETLLEALNLKKRLNNVPSPRDAFQGVKGMVSKGGTNFKKGVNSFRKRVLGKAGKAISNKYDDAHKKLIKAKAKLLLKKKNI